MGKEVGTLRELGVKPGDAVESRGDTFRIESVEGSLAFGVTEWKSGGISNNDVWGMDCPADWRIISRASDTTKTWGEMTDAEKGALLLDEYNGEAIEVLVLVGGKRSWQRKEFDEFHGHMDYRIRPETKRETVTLYGAPSKHIEWRVDQCGLDTHKIQFETIDGKPITGTFRNDAGDVITVEEIQ